jgi:hypothetical protein
LISSATSAGAAPSPLPSSLDLLLALVAIARQSTRCLLEANRETPEWGAAIT